MEEIEALIENSNNQIIDWESIKMVDNDYELS
jgi:hypothetical protein